jgi:hypothetical protein
MSVIDDKYASLSDAAQRLGQPTGQEGDAANGGRFRHISLGRFTAPALMKCTALFYAAWANQG